MCVFKVNFRVWVIPEIREVCSIIKIRCLVNYQNNDEHRRLRNIERNYKIDVVFMMQKVNFTVGGLEEGGEFNLSLKPG